MDPKNSRSNSFAYVYPNCDGIVWPGFVFIQFSLFFSVQTQLISKAVTRINVNFVVSPFTVWSLLVLLAEGSDGETYNQMAKVLNLPPELTHVRTAYKSFQRKLNVNLTTIELAVNQAIYTDTNRPIYSYYANILEEDYEADHMAVNFRNAAIATKTINDHVKAQTRGKITEIVRDTDLKDAQLLLTSAVYFKGQWKVCCC